MLLFCGPNHLRSATNWPTPAQKSIGLLGALNSCAIGTRWPRRRAALLAANLTRPLAADLPKRGPSSSTKTAGQLENSNLRAKRLERRGPEREADGASTRLARSRPNKSGHKKKNNNYISIASKIIVGQRKWFLSLPSLRRAIS